MFTRILYHTLAFAVPSVLAAVFTVPGQVAAQGAYFAPAEGSPEEVTFEYRLREYGCANVRGQWRATNNTDDWLEVRITKTAYNCPGELEDDIRTKTRLRPRTAPATIPSVAARWRAASRCWTTKSKSLRIPTRTDHDVT
jgi:hypothetical protein